MIEKYNYGDYVIVYNGQIYNTKELKETLIKNGFTFEGHCDTEILIKSYIHYGNDVIHHLNGIFQSLVAFRPLGSITINLLCAIQIELLM